MNEIIGGISQHGQATQRAITTIAAAIAEVRGTQPSITGAVEEQRAVASDVAGRVSEVATAIGGIAGNAEFVSTVTNDGIGLATWLQAQVAGPAVSTEPAGGVRARPSLRSRASVG